MDLTYKQLVITNIIFASFLLYWGVRQWWILYLEQFSKGVYARKQLGCRQCIWDGVPRDDQYEVTYFSESFAWNSMREHYLQKHPAELWRVGRVPRGHGPESHQ